jgi:CDP-diacylglycerol---glycerol-3-phosphate 3-phosphatidyltransferase
MNIANILTLIRILLVPVFIMFFYLQIPYQYVYALIVFLIASVTDFLDGVIARKYNLVTDFGKLMDPMADKLLVSAGVIMLVSIGKIHPVLAIILIGREFIISSFRLVAASKGTILAAGSLGKVKTVFQLGGICFLLIEDMLPGILKYAGDVLIYISVIFAIWSSIDYIMKNKSVLDFKDI